LKPMKQMRVSASTPPTTAVATTPWRIRSAPRAMEAPPDAQAITTVSFGPVSPSRQPRVSAWEKGRIERRARMPRAGRPRVSPQYQSSPSSMPPPTAPTIRAASRARAAGSPASASASRAAASAMRSARERRRETPRAPITSAGISAAIKQQNRVGKTAGVVNDLTPQVIAGIKDGTIYGTNRQHFCLMAQDAVKDFVAVSRGQTVPPLTDTGTTFVTKANLQQVLAEVAAGQ